MEANEFPSYFEGTQFAYGSIIEVRGILYEASEEIAVVSNTFVEGRYLRDNKGVLVEIPRKSSNDTRVRFSSCYGRFVRVAGIVSRIEGDWNGYGLRNVRYVVHDDETDRSLCFRHRRYKGEISPNTGRPVDST